MKYLLTCLTIFGMMSCSTSPIEGLWIESNEKELLRFYRDSVISSPFQSPSYYDTFGFRLTDDSITWTGLRPEWNPGATERSFKYTLEGDSLRIYYGPENNPVYFKSDHKSYQEYFLAKGGLKIKLPTAVNVKHTSFFNYGVERINIRIGFKDKAVKVFVEDDETNINDLYGAIFNFKESRKMLYNGIDPFFRCQLFIDEAVTCDFTFRVFESLQANDIRAITFVTETDLYNPNTSDFYGLRYYLPLILK
jgi:hypothetical protein